jgi:hypothetical protein
MYARAILAQITRYLMLFLPASNDNCRQIHYRRVFTYVSTLSFIHVTGDFPGCSIRATAALADSSALLICAAEATGSEDSASGTGGLRSQPQFLLPAMAFSLAARPARTMLRYDQNVGRGWGCGLDIHVHSDSIATMAGADERNLVCIDAGLDGEDTD